MVHLTVELGGGLEVLFGLAPGARFEIDVNPASNGGSALVPAAKAENSAHSAVGAAAVPTAATGGAPAVGSNEVCTAKDLLDTLVETRVRERPELFVCDGTVRPGILVLINDADWELCGGLDAELESGDEVVFISTLHGG